MRKSWRTPTRRSVRAMSRAAALGALACLSLPPDARADDCHPKIDDSVPQYIIGYGSLMETASKRRTAPDTGANLPVRVTGFQRAWNATGSQVGFSTTYLGVLAKQDAPMAAALYRVFEASDIGATDDREAFYCRDAVKPDQVRMLDGSATPRDGEIWIYVNKPDSVAPPSDRFPIVQSYVDIFINGCLELEARATKANETFSEECITTTDGWSEHWVNDRLYPRRPFIHQPNASKIDALLDRMLPDLFKQIRIE